MIELVQLLIDNLRGRGPDVWIPVLGVAFLWWKLRTHEGLLRAFVRIARESREELIKIKTSLEEKVISADKEHQALRDADSDLCDRVTYLEQRRMERDRQLNGGA